MLTSRNSLPAVWRPHSMQNSDISRFISCR
jgi:hypothetical protein